MIPERRLLHPGFPGKVECVWYYKSFLVTCATDLASHEVIWIYEGNYSDLRSLI